MTVPSRPTLTKQQEAMLFRAAGHRVAAAVRSEPAESSRRLLADAADTPVYGAFVTLKRAGQLRSCCGFLGPSASLCEALDHAADRAATADPRFPRIVPAELDQLDMHVWLLWGPEPVAARGEDRAQAVVIGKHGLQISRGSARGLLLPGVAIDYQLDALGFLQQVCLKAGLPVDAWKDDDTTLMVFEGFAIEGPLELVDPDVRPPCVAGAFYPGDPREMQRTLEDLFRDPPPEPAAWPGALAPHAGWMYSGRVAAAVFQRLRIPEQVIILCPKHRPGGAHWAVSPHAGWGIPGGELAGDPELAAHLAAAVAGLRLDAEAHKQEHAIEVQLPLLARLAPQTRVVGIVVGDRPLSELLGFGRQMAAALRGMANRPLLVVSSDMNHFANDRETRRLDRLALDAIETLDPARVHETVQRNQISMCGVAPCVVVMETLRQLDALHRCELVGYATSADAGGGKQRVVGYAGLLFGP